jgi:hypothetical protein
MASENYHTGAFRDIVFMIISLRVPKGLFSKNRYANDPDRMWVIAVAAPKENPIIRVGFKMAAWKMFAYYNGAPWKVLNK